MMDRQQTTLEIYHAEIQTLRRALHGVMAERDELLSCVRWYASPAQWTPVKDDRGRETLTFCWGDDGGERARLSLARWGQLIPQGEAWDSSHEPADRPTWAADLPQEW
jgi:hypothetical protein